MESSEKPVHGGRSVGSRFQQVRHVLEPFGCGTWRNRGNERRDRREKRQVIILFNERKGLPDERCRRPPSGFPHSLQVEQSPFYELVVDGRLRVGCVPTHPDKRFADVPEDVVRDLQWCESDRCLVPRVDQFRYGGSVTTSGASLVYV